jgi:MFS family permease
VPVLLIGRSVQAIGGNGAWIVGLATVADTVGQENTGKVLGGVSSFFNSGLLLGPMLSGTLLHLFGYWPTWVAAITVLVIDILMRLVMIEDRSKDNKGEVSTEASEDVESRTVDEQDVNERTALISPSPDDLGPKTDNILVENFYRVILTNPRAIAGLLCHFTAAFILVTFDTTLPLYVTTEFGWGPAEVSLTFLILQLPSLVFSTFVGTLKDRVGTRVPTALGFISSAVFLALVGLPDRSSGYIGRVIYLVAISGIGIGWTLTAGCGIIEITRRLKALPGNDLLANSHADVMKELEDRRPGRFGPNSKLSSGYSICKVCFTLGTLLGPVATGFMTRTLGYSYMSYGVGRSFPIPLNTTVETHANSAFQESYPLSSVFLQQFS